MIFKNLMTLDRFMELKHSYIQDDLIVEKAKINGIEIPYNVYVYGGNSYGKGRNEHGEPHFYVYNKSKKLQVIFKIPSTNQWKNKKELIIIENNFKNVKTVENIIIDWLDDNNEEQIKLTNLELIRYLWNTLNKENKNVYQIK